MLNSRISLAVGTEAIASIAGSRPSARSTREPLGDICTPGAELAQLGRLLVQRNLEATLQQRQRGDDAADTGAGDQDARLAQVPSPLRWRDQNRERRLDASGRMTCSISHSTQGQAKLLAELPLRLHHHAYAVKDQEANRHFIEDILGIPLVATWCERVFFADVGHEVDFCHTFFEVKDGGALAFFQYADEEAWQKPRRPLQQERGAQHVAFKVTQGTFDELMQRATAAGIPVRKTDHGYCVSMYLKSPDGLRLLAIDLRFGDARRPFDLARWWGPDEGDLDPLGGWTVEHATTVGRGSGGPHRQDY